jgi:hypothetical protein
VLKNKTPKKLHTKVRKLRSIRRQIPKKGQGGERGREEKRGGEGGGRERAERERPGEGREGNFLGFRA